uniref:Odorant receptor n=1 Tax=Streltzoviella insularis TaxID=1206366 RepID=A0A7D5YRU1_9NEOP|nr:odorant receptor 43 [Streltzoviella insularis]
MDDMELRKTHPQKYYLKFICNSLYVLGYGSCWYEETPRTNFHKIFYKIWSGIANFFIVIIVINEIMANFRPNLTAKEQNDLVQFTFGHSLIVAKIVTMYYQRDRIKAVLKKLLEDNRTIFISADIDKSSVKKVKVYCIVLVSTVYLTIVSAYIDGFRAHFNEGIPIRGEITYYPTPLDSGILVNILRFIVEFHWLYIVTVMNLIDCMSYCTLIFLSSQFKLTQTYYNLLRKKYTKNSNKKTCNVLGEEYKKDFLIGIRLHENALWCAHHVQASLGYIYSSQICQSIILIVMCLVKFVTSARNMTVLLANMTYLSAMTVMTGAYMTAGGDITYEASLVSTTMFHSGWDLVVFDKELRTLAVVAIQRSQAPVYMTAFGVIILSYNNLIMVLRSSYSFFAVMY